MSEEITEEVMMSDDVTAEVIESKLKDKGVFDVEEKAEDTSTETEETVLVDKTSTSEQEAIAKGWKPDGPKSADEFLRAEPLYEELKQRGKELKTLRSQVETLTKHVGGLKKAGYQEKIDVIQAERESAVARSDQDSLNYLDDELQKVQIEMVQEVQEVQEPQAHPAALEFLDKYKDVLQDYSLEAQGIKEFIDERDKQLATHNLDPVIHMKTLEKDMKSQFPDRFRTEQQTEAPIMAVESDSRPVTSRRKSKYAFSDLSADQKNIYKYMERKGVMTGPEYIKQLAEIGELK